MDAKVEDWVVTPRIGKPVEVNALWYNALRVMVYFAGPLEGDGRRSPDRAHFASVGDLGRSRESYETLAEQARTGFARFWNAVGYCYDVLDDPEGSDPSLRPNQLFAVSLPHSPLPAEQQEAVVDACARHLLTYHGLHGLDPRHPDCKGHHGGDRRTRDAAYHLGTV